MEKKFDPLPWISLAFTFALTVLCGADHYRHGRSKSSYNNPPPELIEHFTFGFHESVADSLWLRWIQDGDACRTYGTIQTAVSPLPASAIPGIRHRNCDQSWSFKMLDSVTKLSPKFKMPYLAGTMTLSVLVEDYAGATILFDRGVKNFPDDWQILYRAGYHQVFDLHDYPRAAALLLSAADNGGPYWLRMLAARLYTRSGQATLGVTILQSYLKTVTEPEQRKFVEKRIAALKAGSPESNSKGP